MKTAYALLAAIGLAALAAGQMIPLPARIDVWTWSSTNNRFKLEIVPSEVDGRGRGLYKFSADGKQLWTKILPYTLANVDIDDTGRIAGYSSHAIAMDRPFDIALLAPDGKVLMHESYKLDESMDAEDDPRPRGDVVFFEPSQKRVVFDIQTVEKDGSKSEHWWLYSLTGKRIGTLSKAPPGHEEIDKPYTYTPPKPQVLSIHPPAVQLHLDHTWVIPLQERLPGAFKDLRKFEFWGLDRVVGVYQFVRPARPEGSPALIVADLAGKVIYDVPVKGAEGFTPLLAHTRGSTFILECRAENPPLKSSRWSFDAATGKLRSLGDLNDGPRQIAGFADGCFVEQAGSNVQIFDPDGKLLRAVGRHRPSDKYGRTIIDPDNPTADTYVTGIGVDVAQHLVVGIKDRLLWFDENGKYLRSVQYPGMGPEVTLRLLPSGEAWSVDVWAVHRFSLRGADIQEVHPVFRDGRKLDDANDLRTDSKGGLWVSDAEGIFPMTATGRLGDGLGASASTEAPTEVNQLILKADGSAIASDRLTAKIFFYSREGRLLHVGSPVASDFAKWPPELGLMGVAPNGNVFMGLSWFSTKQFLKFSPTGERLAKLWVPIDSADDSAEVFGKPVPPVTEDRSNLWWMDGSLMDGGGRVLRTVTRWPDASWLQGAEFAEAPDGSLMTVAAEWQGDAYGVTNPTEIGFFSADGEPLSMSPLPQGLGEIHWYNCAYDGKLSYIYSNGLVYAFDKSGHAVWSFKPPHPVVQVLVSRGDLALFYGKTIEWYSTPGAPRSSGHKIRRLTSLPTGRPKPSTPQ